MTLASTPLGTRSAHTPSEVFAAGSSVGRRRMWVALGCGLLMAAYFDWLLGEWSPGIAALTAPSALVVGIAGLAVLSIGIWRRARSYQVRGTGILLVAGGPGLRRSTAPPMGKPHAFRRPARWAG